MSSTIYTFSLRSIYNSDRLDSYRVRAVRGQLKNKICTDKCRKLYICIYYTNGLGIYI